MKIDVIVIGGGPAGLMAAISAAEHGAAVLLLDKGNKLGRKLAISGGGRCNVTNNQPIDELISNIPGNGRFMYSPFSVFNNEDIIHFFENLGISLKEEDRGRMFPKNDDAKSVVNALISKMKELSVQIRKNIRVIDVLYDESEVRGVKLETGEIIEANKVIVAVGGKSVPHTGSTGDGYPWAKRAGHSITELYPTEVPITLNDPFIKNRQLQGLSLQNVSLSVKDPKNKKNLVTHQGDMIFTHFGISGPISLRCSQFVVKALKKHTVSSVMMEIDVFVDKNEDELLLELETLLAGQPKKMLKNVLLGWLPERLIPLLLELAVTDPMIVSAELSNEKKEENCSFIKALSSSCNWHFAN